jgi:hypothetical protein
MIRRLLRAGRVVLVLGLVGLLLGGLGGLSGPAAAVVGWAVLAYVTWRAWPAVLGDLARLRWPRRLGWRRRAAGGDVL